MSGDSVALLFSPEEILKDSDIQKALVSTDAGVVISSHGSSLLFKTKDSASPSIFKKPASVIFASSDR